eukprot:TRINITY_DN659_c0_g1_i2.p1 TRINITY_DN659_c0_g1~~TRINITY_DN659_c0_g1_i2.p1  ORF type:complete len:212 (-),score=48.03 TRINITY_DN659_c0_g1_i2:77-712(-)
MTTTSSPWSTTWGASAPNDVPASFSSASAAPSPPSFSSSLFKDAGARDAWAESAQGPRRAAPMPANTKVLSMRKTRPAASAPLTRKTPTLLQTPHQVQVRSAQALAPTPAPAPSTPKRSAKGRSGGRSRRGTPIESSLQRQDLFKTEVCRSFQETGACRYGSKCQFAHGESELRPVLRHPKYKTELCRTFETKGRLPLPCFFTFLVSSFVS